MTIAAIISGKTVLGLIVGALVAGIGLTASFSLVIYGAARAGEARRVARRGAASAYAGLSALALAACAAIVAYGFVLVASKPK